ncbi:MAG: trypsin-like serine protease [Acidobacteria bacterium]|nr:trypsin-like serine protease [Acidobacteriota bacterium]
MSARMTLARMAVGIAAVAAMTAPACGGGSNSTPTTPTSPTSPSNPIPPVTGNACGAVAGFLTTPETIVNGTDCVPQAASSSVLWLQVLVGAEKLDHYCSGTVIDSQWVMTAAHCLHADAADVTGVRVDLGSGPFVFSTEFHASPGYSGTGASSLDVGVVKFSQSLGRTPTPLLLSRDVSRGEQGVIAGYGQSATGSIGTLRAGFVTVSDVTSSYLVVTATTPTASSVCAGDSGGPLLISDGGVWAVAGITSSATDYCVNGTSNFARVKNDGISSFILSYVSNAAQR